MNKEEEMQQMQLLLTSMSGMDTNTAINNIEAQGRNNILSKTQLPIYASKINDKRFWERADSKELVKKKYKEIGIEIINEENDLFYNVKLPENIKLNPTESNYWTNLIDNNGKELGSIFLQSCIL